jgi:four helix bundle protein
MAGTSFENLQVYRLSEKLAAEVWRLVLGWDYFSKATVGRQVVRAADSIGANIAEGTGRGSFQDNRRFVRTARGSMFETRHWLRRAHRRGLLNQESVSRIKPILDELGPKLNAYLRSIGEGTATKDTAQPRLATKDKGLMTKDKGPRTAKKEPV